MRVDYLLTNQRCPKCQTPLAEVAQSSLNEMLRPPGVGDFTICGNRDCVITLVFDVEGLREATARDWEIAGPGVSALVRKQHDLVRQIAKLSKARR